MSVHIPSSSLRLAFVTPFFGREAQRPEEQRTYAWASRLAARGVYIEVITTCGRGADYDWSSNYYRAGRDGSEGYSVERFPLDRRDRPAFEAAVLRLAADPANRSAAEVWRREGPRSETLLAHVRRVADQFDALLVTPAASPLAVAAIVEAPERAIVMPQLGAAGVPPAGREALNIARAFAAESAAEREALVEMFGGARAQSIVETGPDAEAGWDDAIEALLKLAGALAGLDDGRSRAEALAQVAYLYPVARRQRAVIAAMQQSRFWKVRNSWFAVKRRLRLGADPVPILRREQEASELGIISDPYALWRYLHARRPYDAERSADLAGVLPDLGTVRIFVDARGARGAALTTTLRTLERQVWPRWEAVVAGATHVPVDPRYIPFGGGSWAAGADWLTTLHAGDELEPDALLELIVACIARDAAAIYSDDDEVDASGRYFSPRFKPDWSPETALSRDYVGRALLVRAARAEAAGGVDVEDPAGWYDLLLRLADRDERIAHAVRPLYHLRSRDDDDAEPARRVAAARAVARRGRQADFVDLPRSGGRAVAVRWRNGDHPRVTVIVPTRDRADLVATALDSIFVRSTYPAFEVLLVDNGSREPATAALFERWREAEPSRFRVLRDNDQFNYSRLNNRAAAATDADILVLLNNDTEVLSPDWLEALVEQARQPEIGAVGAMLLYADGSVQHAGILLGVLDLAGHAHRGEAADAPGYLGSLQSPTNYSAVTAATLAVARQKYLDVGGFDESLAVSFNDVDFCLRLGAAGYRNLYLPYVQLHHFESKSRGAEDTLAKVRRAVGEMELVRSRYPDIARRDPYYNPNLTQESENFEVRL